MHQEMLPHEKHRNNLRRVIAESLNAGDLRLLALYEVCGHVQGPQHFQINPLDFIHGVLPDGEYDAAAVQAYMNVWHKAGAAQPSGVSLELSTRPTCVQLSSQALDPQLVIFEFQVTAEGHEGKMGRLLHGLLHISIPHGEKVKDTIKKTLTKQALAELKNRANRGALQPTVSVLIGDVNLSQQSAYTVVQLSLIHI